MIETESEPSYAIRKRVTEARSLLKSTAQLIRHLRNCLNPPLKN
ncbi:hypothetical protein QUF90_19975 [Desulfococcaceae bacterium HSG9]|nr:hypothetical protein [Desulfococcaceae bacterium HSG9]